MPWKPHVQPRARRPRPKVVTLTDARRRARARDHGQGREALCGPARRGEERRLRRPGIRPRIRRGRRAAGRGGRGQGRHHPDRAQGGAVPDRLARSTTRPASWRPSSCSTIPTRPTPAAAARASPSSPPRRTSRGVPVQRPNSARSALARTLRCGERMEASHGDPGGKARDVSAAARARLLCHSQSLGRGQRQASREPGLQGAGLDQRRLRRSFWAGPTMASPSRKC